MTTHFLWHLFCRKRKIRSVHIWENWKQTSSLSLCKFRDFFWNLFINIPIFINYTFINVLININSIIHSWKRFKSKYKYEIIKFPNDKMGLVSERTEVAFGTCVSHCVGHTEYLPHSACWLPFIVSEWHLVNYHQIDH